MEKLLGMKILYLALRSLKYLVCVCLFYFFKDGPRPNQKEMLSLRAFLLMFIKQLVMKVSSYFLAYSMFLL